MQSKPTPSITRRFSAAALCVALALTPPKFANAEDIDLFLNAAATSSTRPNVLIFLDNSANWNSNAQHWPSPTGSGTFKQGQSELRAIRTILDELNVNAATPSVNLGLMMFRSGSPDGGFVRFGIRTMNTANIAAFKELIGPDSGCTAGNNSLNGTPNCLLQNFSGGSGIEQVNSASTSYSGGLFDAYKYFGGFTSPAFAQSDAQPPSAINDSTHYGHARYLGGASFSRMDPAAYTTAVTDKDTYVSPIDSPCAKNYVIFIGNGFPSQDTGNTLIQNVNTGTTPALPNQLAMQNFTTLTGTVVTDLGTDAACKSTAQCATDAAAVHGTDYDTYSCTGGSTVDTPTPLGVDAVCETNAACISRASGTPGYTSYSCSGGSTVPGGATTLAPDIVCESSAACVSRAQTTYGTTYNTYACTGGITTGDVLSTSFSPSTCIDSSTCVTNATTTYGGLGYTSFSCASGAASGCGGVGRKGWTVTGNVAGCTSVNRKNWTVTGTVTGCTSGNLINQSMQGSTSCTQNMTIQGTKAVTTVTPLSTFTTPSAGTVNYADEWAQLLYTTDVTDRPGQQNAAVFTIDVYKDAQDANETALLFNMAKYGGGKYFQASNEDAIINALRQILIEIQSVNSVFASASLPINATNRAQNENQVFIGMFRPDGAGNPRWYGNLKRYQIAKFGQDFKLADASTPPLDAVSTTTGFLQPCAKSFWTQDSGDSYWSFQSGSAGKCATAGDSRKFSDAPDGPQVEKGAVAEVLRRGNNPPTTPGVQSPLPGVNRTLYTCANSTNCCVTSATTTCGASPTNEMMIFNSDNVSKTQLGDAAMSDLLRDNIINYTKGTDVDDKNNNANVTDVRASIHGDVAHSRPLPVNYGGTTGVVLYYGANDGTFRAVRGSDSTDTIPVTDGGKELWAFLAPEHHSRLKRLTENSPSILYTGQVSPPAGATAKDYFFDGSAGLFQNSNNSNVWLFPTMRRGGRMLYAFDVTSPAAPTMKWRLGCTNSNLSDTSSCKDGLGTAAFTQMGQSWSIPSVMLVKGYGTDANDPLIIMGGGYDGCEDQDVAPNTACTSRKGNAVYVINANTGELVKTFATAGSVPSDVTLVDRDFDGFADHAYVSDTLGNFYRIDFVNPAIVSSTRGVADWKINRIGYTTGGNRKFLFAPAVLPSTGKLYITNTSGDRERPLISNYPSDKLGTKSPGGLGVKNRAYMLIDNLSVTTDIATDAVTGTPINMDSASMQADDPLILNDCTRTSAEAGGFRGWRFNLDNGTGEQGVTSSIIFGGLVFFSTNRPVATAVGACANDLGEARGYAVNLLTASGAVGTDNLCGGNRSGIFIGGGLPPSPVTGVVPVDGVPVTVMIGGIQRTGGASSPIGSQRVRPIISQKRSRIYWYRDGDK